MPRKSYNTGHSDAQRELLAPLQSPAKVAGRPRWLDLRNIYQCAREPALAGWSSATHSPRLTRWGIVSVYFRHWREDGVLERTLDAQRD